MNDAATTCPCGSSDFEPGWVDDVIQATVRWVPRQVSRRLFARRDQQGDSRRVMAFRCRSCSRLELYAGETGHDGEAGPYGSHEPGPDGAVL